MTVSQKDSCFVNVSMLSSCQLHFIDDATGVYRTFYIPNPKHRGPVNGTSVIVHPIPVLAKGHHVLLTTVV